MDPAAWVGIAVGLTVLLGFGGRIFAFFIRLERLFGPDEDGQSLRDRVRSVEKALNNGLRTEVRQALTESSEARRLAGDAARAAAVASQRAEEGRNDLQRAINAMRAEMNALTNVALTDHADIWTVLSEAGLDRRGGASRGPAPTP